MSLRPGRGGRTEKNREEGGDEKEAENVG